MQEEYVDFKYFPNASDTDAKIRVSFSGKYFHRMDGTNAFLVNLVHEHQ